MCVRIIQILMTGLALAGTALAQAHFGIFQVNGPAPVSDIVSENSDQITSEVGDIVVSQ